MTKQEWLQERLKEELKEQLERNACNCSDECYGVIESIINDYNFTNEDEFKEIIWQEVEECFIYYAAAFDYIRDQWITSFKEAFDEGFGENICTIASYYLEQEVYSFVNDYLDFDIEEPTIEDMFKAVGVKKVFKKNGYFTKEALKYYYDVSEKFFDGDDDELDGLCREEHCFDENYLESF